MIFILFLDIAHTYKTTPNRDIFNRYLFYHQQFQPTVIWNISTHISSSLYIIIHIPNTHRTQRKRRIKIQIIERSTGKNQKQKWTKNRQITNANLIDPLTRSANETCNYHFVADRSGGAITTFPLSVFFVFLDMYFFFCVNGAYAFRYFINAPYVCDRRNDLKHSLRTLHEPLSVQSAAKGYGLFAFTTITMLKKRRQFALSLKLWYFGQILWIYTDIFWIGYIQIFSCMNKLIGKFIRFIFELSIYHWS